MVLVELEIEEIEVLVNCVDLADGEYNLFIDEDDRSYNAQKKLKDVLKYEKNRRIGDNKKMDNLRKEHDIKEEEYIILMTERDSMLKKRKEASERVKIVEKEMDELYNKIETLAKRIQIMRNEMIRISNLKE